MATEDVTTTQSAGLTIFARFVQGDGTTFDFDGNTWEVSPTQPKLSLTERTAIGDAGLSVYASTIDLDLLHSAESSLAVVVQFLEDQTPDRLLTDFGTHIFAGEVVHAKNARVELVKAVTDAIPDSGAMTAIGTDTARLTAVRAQVLTDWIDGGRLDSILDAILAAIGALNDLDKATVKEILFTDTTSELPQQAPPANATLAVQVRYLYQYAMGLRTTTETELSMFDAAGTTKIAKATLSDDGATGTKGALVSGA